MHVHLALFDAKTKRAHGVGSGQRLVQVKEKEGLLLSLATCVGARAVGLDADAEKRLVEGAKELEVFFAGPLVEIQLLFHRFGGDVRLARAGAP